MRTDNPYSPPSIQNGPERAPQRGQAPWRAWFRCWMGIGVGGTVTGFSLGGVWGLLNLGLRSFAAGFVSSAVVFGAMALVCDGNLSRRVSNASSVASGVGTGLILYSLYPFVIPTLIVTVGLVLGSISPELIFWDRRDHGRVVRMAERFRGVSETFHVQVTDTSAVEGDEQ